MPSIHTDQPEKPVALKVAPDFIPFELKRRAQWVLWRYELRDGRWTKPPFMPDGRRASHSDPSTWSTFDAVWAAYIAGGFDGLGYVLSLEDEFFGLDLDHCLDPLGGLDDWAQEIVTSFASHTQITPSGAGLRIIGQGNLPGKGRKCGKLGPDGTGALEVYDRLRFLSMTGHPLPSTNPAVISCQPALDALLKRYWPAPPLASNGAPRTANAAPGLDDAALLERVRNSRAGDRFAQLHDRGDWRGAGYASQSEADLALCGILGFWFGGDAATIDRVFRSSALMRDKWDRADYREDTIARAIAGRSDYYDPHRSARDGVASASARPRDDDDPFADLPTEPPAEKEKDKWNAARVDAEIKRKFNYYATQDPGKKLYIYQNGVYREGGEQVREWVKAIVPDDHWSVRLTNETIEHVRIGSRRLWDCPSPDVVNVRNGLLNVHTRKLSPHSPNHLSSVQLPIIYDGKATCPAWEEQLEQTLAADVVTAGVIWQIIAWFMLGLSCVQKAVLLLGDGGTGKSTLINMIVAFLGGRDNVSSLSLQELETNRFAKARLLGKLLNACPDLPSTHLETSSVFKALTGTDRHLEAERKFVDGFSFTPFCALLFSANQPPVSKDATDAFFQRWRVLAMNQVFRGTDKEVDRNTLDAKLSTASELSGVLNKALDALPLVLKSGISQTASMKQSAEDFRRETDPLAIWLNIHTVDNPNAIVGASELIARYNADALAGESATLSNTAFGKAIRRLRPHAVRKQELYGGNPKAWVYRGIGWAAREQGSAQESTASAPYETANPIICRQCGTQNPADEVRCFACDEGLDGEAAI